MLDRQDLDPSISDRDLIAQTEFFSEAVLDVMVWEAEREAFLARTLDAPPEAAASSRRWRILPAR